MFEADEMWFRCSLNLQLKWETANEFKSKKSPTEKKLKLKKIEQEKTHLKNASEKPRLKKK